MSIEYLVNLQSDITEEVISTLSQAADEVTVREGGVTACDFRVPGDLDTSGSSYSIYIVRPKQIILSIHSPLVEATYRGVYVLANSLLNSGLIFSIEDV